MPGIVGPRWIGSRGDWSPGDGAQIIVHAAAAGLLASVLIPLPFALGSLSRLINLSLRDWLSITWRPLLSTAMMGLAIMIWLSFTFPVTGHEGSPLLTLLPSVILGAVTYAVFIIVFWALAGKPAGPERYLIERVVTVVQRSVA